MARIKDRFMESSHWVVRIALLLNRSFAVAVFVGLLFSWLFRTAFVALMLGDHSGTDVQAKLTGLRLLMLLGLAMAAAPEFLLAALARIVASAAAGDPFTDLNAVRLRRIGWALLMLQLLDLPGALLQRFSPNLGSAAPDVTFAPGGWLAVLMIFVLSRVFTAGAAMRNDLEGTV